MAKGKHAAALFEVIKGDKRLQRTSEGGAGGLRTPSWWFKSRPKNESAADASPAAPLPAPAPVTRMAVNPDRQVISFTLSYTQVIVIGFAIFVAVVMAIIIGRHTVAPMPTLSPSDEVIRGGPAQPSVMDVTENSQPSVPTEHVAEAAKPTGAGVPQVWTGPKAPAAVVDQNARRAVGLNYIVVQGYPDEKNAQDAKAALARGGIAATVEKGLPRFRSDWYYVVGIDGFNRVTSQECQAYIRKIEHIGKQYAGQRSFKAFQPTGYKWTGQVGG